MVRLLLTDLRICSKNVPAFNPTMVRLLRESDMTNELLVLAFQSHNGAIAAAQKFLSLSLVSVFQSHNGAIAAWNANTMSDTSKHFQSHNGAIAA